jgi:hypothetical protein
VLIPSIKNWTAIAKTIIAIIAVTTLSPSSPKYLNKRVEYLMPIKDANTPTNIAMNTKEVSKRLCDFEVNKITVVMGTWTCS